jgi:hypothetical protein
LFQGGNIVMSQSWDTYIVNIQDHNRLWPIHVAPMS